jgi:CBS-domain-containing membrane protein
MAPVGQPKNVLFGQVIATIVALTVSNATKNWFHKSLRISLSTATAITAKVLLGITHPPAGATALIISSGEFSSKILVSVVLSNLIAIVFSTLINNLSQKRQYPTYLKMGEDLIYYFGRLKGVDYNNHANHSSHFDKKSSSMSHSNDVKSGPCFDSNSCCDDYHHNPLHNEDNALTKQMLPSSADVLCLDNNTPSMTYNYGSMFIPPLLLPGRNDKSTFDNSASSDCSSDLEDFPL